MKDIKTLRALLYQLIEMDAVRFFFVGGLVRDLLLHRQTTDIDIAFEGDFAKVYQKLSANYAVTASRVSTLQFEVGCFSIDLAMMRKEIYPNADGFPVVEPASPKRDMMRRDFTVNTAYALVCEENIEAVCRHLSNERPAGFEIAYAHTHFLRDLNNRVIAVLHSQSFEEDPTRLLRAVKYMTGHGFKMDRKTRGYFFDSIEAGAIKRLPIPRLYGALAKLMDLTVWLEAITVIADYKLLSSYFNSELPKLDASAAMVWYELAEQNTFYKFAVCFDSEIELFASHFGKRTDKYMRGRAAIDTMAASNPLLGNQLFTLYSLMQNMPGEVRAALGYYIQCHHSALLAPYRYLTAIDATIAIPLDGNAIMAMGVANTNIKAVKEMLLQLTLENDYHGNPALTELEIRTAIKAWL